MGERFKGAIHGFLYGNFEKQSVGVYLPPYILSTIKHSPESKIGIDMFNDLIDKGFIDGATYLLTKALKYEPNHLKEFLEKYVDIVSQQPDNPNALQPLMKEATSQIDPQTSVWGAKLVQINRYGYDVWDSHVKKVAEEIKSEPATPVILASGGMLTFRHITSMLSPESRQAIVLIPKWFESGDQQICGLSVDYGKPYGERVELLPENFKRPEQFTLVDDTVKSMRHMQEAWDFLNRKKSPLDTNKIKAIVRAA